MTETGRRLVAIEGGGDWADASVDYLSIPATVDLEEARKAWDVWYREVYCNHQLYQKYPYTPVKNQEPYRSFTQWLVEHYGAILNPVEIEVFRGA